MELTSKDSAFARESCGLDGVVDGVVGSGLTGDRVPQPLEGVITGLLGGKGDSGEHAWKRKKKQMRFDDRLKDLRSLKFDGR